MNLRVSDSEAEAEAETSTPNPESLDFSRLTGGGKYFSTIVSNLFNLVGSQFTLNKFLQLCHSRLESRKKIHGVSSAIGSSILLSERKKQLSNWQLCAFLAKKLLCFNNRFAVDKPVRHGHAILSRLHRLNKQPDAHVDKIVNVHSYNLGCMAIGNGIIANSTDNLLELRNFSSERFIGGLITTLPEEESRINSIAFKTKGKPFLATSSDNDVKIWSPSSQDGKKWKCVQTLGDHTDVVITVKFSETGCYLVTGSLDKTAKVWKLLKSFDGTKSWICVGTLSGHSRGVISLAFHSNEDGSLILATGSADNTIKVWTPNKSSDETEWLCIDTLVGHSNWVSSIDFHKNMPILVSGSKDASIKIWMRSDSGQFVCVSTLNQHRSPVTSVVFSPNGCILASGSENDSCKIWNLNFSSNTCVATCVSTKTFEDGVKQLEFCSIDTLVICQYNGICVFN
jgi:WD40 repeat protein